MPTSPTTRRISRPPAASRAPTGKRHRRVRIDGAEVHRGGRRLAQGDHEGCRSRRSVTFRQTYRSDKLQEQRARKTLELVQTDGQWLIQEEKAAK